MLYVEQIEDAADRVIDHAADVFDLTVERWHRREDDAAHFRDRHHIAQVREVERGFARDQHEATAFFQNHVGSARHQIVGVGVGHRREGFHRARCDHHALREEGAAGNRRADIARVVDDVGQRFYVAPLEAPIVSATRLTRQPKPKASRAPEKK